MTLELDIWTIESPTQEIDTGKLISALSDIEKTRAASFHRQRDRHRFICFHYALRSILATYFASDSEVSIVHGKYGKPLLAALPHEGELWFNLSHSSDRGMLAISRAGEIGADIEYIDPKVQIEQLAQQIMSPAQLAQFSRYPPDSQRDVLFECWVRKEAYLKALGVGLEISPRDVEVPIEPEKTSGAVSSTRHIGQWRYVSFGLDSQFRSAVCFHHDMPKRIRYLDWDASAFINR